MEGYDITDAQVRAEYEALYRPQPTPFTHPELYDPLNPPAGWAYDRWHACWYRTEQNEESLLEMRIVGMSTLCFLLCFGIYTIIKAF